MPSRSSSKTALFGAPNDARELTNESSFTEETVRRREVMPEQLRQFHVDFGMLDPMLYE